MSINIEVTVNSSIDKVWETWVTPEHIKIWNSASDDWHTTMAEVELKVGGGFLSRMEAKDSSVGFDFKGVYQKIVPKKLIEYSLEDGREVIVTFEAVENGVKVTETFDAEMENSIEAQKKGWLLILKNFAKYVESRV